MLKKTIFLSVACFLFSYLSQAQKGRISGKVLSARTGEALIGASVTLTPGNKSAQTDQNGFFAFSGLAKGTYSLSSSYVGYKSKSLPDISLNEDEALSVDIVLDRAGDLGAVVVKSTGGLNRPRESVSSLLIAQKNSASVSDGVSAEAIRRTPDRNSGDVLRRVPGASLQEDRFAVIRGLNDRYNAAFINGAPLPSSESDRKAFAFDIFPSNMLDNLIIYKTATPDMPAEFAGGQIVINTKGIPNENFQSFSVGMGFNTVTTFRDKKYYDGGQFDFLGIDNTRALPASFPDIAAFKAMPVRDRNKYAARFQPRNWGLLNKNALPNTSLQYILGRNFQRKQKDFMGLLFSVSYNKTLSRNEGTRTFFAPEYENQAQRIYTEDNYNTQTLLGAIANLSFKFSNNHSLSFKNLFSINSDDRVLTREGKDDAINEPDRYTRSFALWFTSNRILTNQLIGEHYFPTPKIKLNWTASYSSIARDVPALRRMVYDSVAGSDAWLAKLLDPNPVDNDNTAGLTFYSTNREKVYNARFDVSRNVIFSDKFQSLFKVGGYFQQRDRTFNPRLLAFCNFNTPTFDVSILQQNPAVVFGQNNIGYLSGGRTGLTLKDITEIRDLYTAGTDLYSAYAMTDQRFGKKLRLIYGVRLEQFRQKLNAEFNAFTPVRVNTLTTDLLPSANLVFSPTTKQNIRLCYSKTLNRPEFRELAPFLFRDYTIRYAIFGDTSLVRATIDNFDFRYEIFPGKAQIFSVSAFHKRFINPIELISARNQDRTLTYRNTPSATLTGAELEFRALLGEWVGSGSPVWNRLTVFGNFTWVTSKVDLKITDTSNYFSRTGRPIQGQSPYVLNGGITYVDDDRGISSTLSVNRYGQRIFLASNGDQFQNGVLIEPNLWENGRTQLDFQFSKSFPKKNLELRLNVKDILAQTLFFYEDINNNGKFDKTTDGVRSTQRFGRVISATLTCKF